MYQIESIKLKHFDGLWLNKIETLEMTVVDAVTIILGRNGCGKSRLISMLSPLTPTRFDILPGGHKIQVVRLDNVRYELSTLNHNNSMKSTLTNLTTGEVLLENCNNSVFNKKVKELFKYDKDLHDLLTGRVKLTSMSVGDRKKWFSSLSESDLTYALGFFKRTKEHYRDLTGSIKSLRYSIGEMRPRVLESEEERIATRDRLTSLQEDISILDRAIDRCQSNPKITEHTLTAIEERLTKVNQEVLKLDIHIPASLQHLSIRELEQELAGHEAHYQQSLERLADVQSRLGKAKQLNDVDVDALKRYTDDIRKEIADTDGSLGELTFRSLSNCTTPELEQVHGSADNYIETLSNGLKSFAVDFPVDNLTERFTNQQQASGELTGRVNVLARKEHELTMRIKAYHDAADVVCDNCTHRFKPGMSQQELVLIQDTLQQTSAELERAKARLGECNDWVTTYGKLLHVRDRINDVGKYFKNSRPIMELFNYLATNEAFSKNPLSYLPILQRFQHEVELMLRRGRLSDRLVQVNDEIKLATATQTEDVDALNAIVTDLESRINTHLSRRSVIQQQLQLFSDVERRQQRASELATTHTTLLKEHGSLSDTLVNNIRQELLSEHRQQLWDILITTRQRFDEMEQERRRLEDQEQQLASQLTRVEAVKLTMDAMSPDSGILAKYLYQCIERITNLMTEYVEQVWGYQMQILPCDVSDADMDYKFPYWSGDDSRPRADISLGSVGQKEVFDFVFVLAVYRALGLERYPVFLDELGSGFDQGHRASMIEFVKELLGSGFCSQVFMVSHDPGSHFKLANAANVVIDQEGITLPQVYNEHVSITYM